MRSGPRTTLSPDSGWSHSQVSPGSTSRSLCVDDCVSHNALRTGSSRYRHVHARLATLLLLVRVSWLTMSPVSPLILKTRPDAVPSSIVVMLVRLWLLGAHKASQLHFWETQVIRSGKHTVLRSYTFHLLEHYHWVFLPLYPQDPRPRTVSCGLACLSCFRRPAVKFASSSDSSRPLASFR